MLRNLIISSLLLPLTAFGTITVSDRGTGSDNAAASSLTITYSGTSMAANSTGILFLAMDNASGGSTNVNGTSFTDSVGNVWYVMQDQFSGTANNTCESAAFTSRLGASGFPNGSMLALTFNASTQAKTWTWTEAAPTSGNTVVYVNGGKNSSAAVTSLTVTSAGIHTGDLVVGATGAENAAATIVGDSDTTLGSWSTAQATTVGTTTTGIAISSQNKIVTGYGAQIYNTTFASSDASILQMTFTETNAKARTVTSDGASSTTVTVPINFPIASGSIGVLCLAADNSGSAGGVVNIPSSMTDSKSNAWTLRQNQFHDPGIANGGSEVGIYTAPITTPLVIGDTITGTASVTIPAKAYTVWEFAPTVGGSAMTYVSGGLGTGATATSWSVTTSSITSGDYVVGALAMQGAATGTNSPTGDSDTTNGTWKAAAISGAGLTGAASMHGLTQWKLTTATATQTWDTAIDVSSSGIQAWVSLHDASPTGITAQQKAGFFLLFP